MTSPDKHHPRNPDTDSQWFALRTASRRETAAHNGLVEQGFTVFLPHETHIRQTSRTPRERVSSPLFPGYLFVLCGARDFPAILEIEAVSQFVKKTRADGETEPVAFPACAILGLQIEERSGLFDRTRKVKLPYRPRKDEKVRITAGTWMGYIAKVLSTPGGERAHVMVEGPFGRGVVVDVVRLSAA